MSAAGDGRRASVAVDADEVGRDPYAEWALDVAVLPVTEVAGRLGLTVSRVHQLVRDGQLLSLRREGAVVVPADFLDGATVIVPDRPLTTVAPSRKSAGTTTAPSRRNDSS